MRVFEAVVLAVVAGFLSGLIGIAGGVVLIPAFVYILGMEPLKAAGTTLAALLLPVGFFAVARYWQAGNVDVKIAAVTAAGVLAAAPVGASIALRVGNATVGRVFGIVLIGVGISFIFRA